MSLKYNLHHFFNYIPDNLNTINDLSINDDLKKLAVLKRSIPKNDNDFSITTIEIWNFEFDRFFVEQRIYDNFKQPQLAESIEWGINNRLFTVGLNEKLNEFNLTNGSIKKSYQIISGPAYCMKFNKTKELVAIGTDHGYICIFNICENSKRNEVVLDKNLKITSKVFSIDWYNDKDGNEMLICSTTGQIRIFDFKSGIQKDVIYLDLKDCHIWSVCALPIEDEFVIISGDSSGNVTFWDGLTCTQIQSLKLHDNDVNAVCFKNGKRAFSIGLDGRLCKFSYLNGRIIVQGNQQYISDYELKSIVSSESLNCLFIGSSDSELKKADPKSQSVKRIQSELQHCIHSFDDNIMYQLEKCLRLYKLDLELSDQPIYLGTIVSKNEIITSAINRKYIAFSDYHKITILNRKEDNFKRLCKIDNSKLDFNIQNLFLNKSILYVQTSRSLHQYDLNKLKKQDNDEQLELNKLKFKNRIFKCLLSKCFIAIIFENNLIEIYDLKLNFISSLETKSLALIGEWQTDSILWLITNNNLYIIYDVIDKKILRSDELLSLLGSKEFNWRTAIEGITFTPQSTILYTKSRIWSIKEESETNENNVKVNLTYKNIVKFSKFNETDFYLVELPNENLVKHLGPKISRKKFGLN